MAIFGVSPDNEALAELLDGILFTTVVVVVLEDTVATVVLLTAADKIDVVGTVDVVTLGELICTTVVTAVDAAATAVLVD